MSSVKPLGQLHAVSLEINTKIPLLIYSETAWNCTWGFTELIMFLHWFKRAHKMYIICCRCENYIKQWHNIYIWKILFRIISVLWGHTTSLWWNLQEKLDIFNPLSTNVPLLFPLKTSENLWFSDVFRRCRSGTLAESGLRMFV